MVFDKMFFFLFVSLHPSKIAFLLLSIFYISHFLSVKSQLTKEQKVVLTPLLSTQPAHFLRLFSPTCQPLPTPPPQQQKKKQTASPPLQTRRLPARPAQNPFNLQSYTIYILYFVVIAQKVFNDLELTRTISLISLSKNFRCFSVPVL